MTDLIKELGLEKFTEEEKNQVLIQVTDSLLKRLLLRVYDKLGIADQKEFDRLGEAKDFEKINKFLSEKIPDLDQVRDEELSGLIEEMKDFLKTVK